MFFLRKAFEFFSNVVDVITTDFRCRFYLIFFFTLALELM